MADPELVRLHPPYQNAGGISAEPHQSHPCCDLAKHLLSKNPGANVQKPRQTVNKGNNRQY
jgi:hypothetical protein